MRLYIPATASDLTASTISPRRVHTVTREAVQEFPEADQESLEMLATLYAADDSLLLLQATNCAYLRRIVVVGEAPDGWVRLPDSRSGAHTTSGARAESTMQTGCEEQAESEVPPTAVELLNEVPWDRIESIHIDEPGYEALVSAAIAGDDAAFEATENIELLWYDVTELQELAVRVGAEQAE